MRTKILFMVIVFAVFFGVYEAVSKPPAGKAVEKGQFKNASVIISAQQAREWVYNYAQLPVNQIAYPADTGLVKIKSFELDNKIIDTIRSHAEIRGLRCYFAKRTSDPSKKDYTVIVVPYNSGFANIFYYLLRCIFI